MKKTFIFSVLAVSLTLSGCAKQPPAQNQNLNQTNVNQNQNINASNTNQNQNGNQPQNCTNYILDQSHKITDDAKKPQGTVPNIKSPNDNSALKEIIIDPDDPNIMDEPWRKAYYSQSENVFWIVDMPGELRGGWYGPYPGYPCLPQAKADTNVKLNGNYLGSEYKGNYVWGGAMNLAWNELNENILHEKLKLNTSDKIALEMADKFNNPVFTKNDLDEKSYYIKSGYGQKTVETINRESKAKFPTKSFGDLQMNLSPTDIISYAYFLKEVEYLTIFDKKDVSFNGQKVMGFYAKGQDQRNNLKIIKYENDDKFIISLQLKDGTDRLILAKGYNMDDPSAVVKEIDQNNQGYLNNIGDSDRFEAPNLHLDHHRDYIELIGKGLANKGFESYFIGAMFENIKFDMNEKGARVENEAVIVMPTAIREPEKPKNFILDKPYWVVMVRQNSHNPYFILGVKNSELMSAAN